jgi:hypothetical protein
MCDEEGLWYGGEKFVSWAVRKTQIVQTFTTTGTIQMPSFVSSEVRFGIHSYVFAGPHGPLMRCHHHTKQVAKAGRGGNTLRARLASVEDAGDDEVSMVSSRATADARRPTSITTPRSPNTH